MGKLAEAEADFEAVLPKRPDMEWLWLWWGQARLRAGDLAGAEARLDEALRIGPRLAEALEARGRVRLARGRRAEALDDLERAIRANDALEPTLRPLIRSLRVGAGGGGPAGPGR
jgi:tetratricopeptide (TPR) repeat protein